MEMCRIINRINDHTTDTNGGTMSIIRDDKIFASFLFRVRSLEWIESFDLCLNKVTTWHFGKRLMSEHN